MAGLYSKNAGAKLRERLDAIRDESAERMSLVEEIDVARAMALDAMKLFEASLESKDAKTRGQAMALMRNSLAFVGELVTKASKVQALVGGTFTAEDVGYMVAQVTKIIEDEVAEHSREMADRVIARLDEIRTPARAVQITID